MKKADIFISLCLIALGSSAYYVASSEYNEGTQYAPILYSVGLIILALILLASSLLKKKTENGGQARPQSLLRLLTVLGFIAAYIALIHYAGFYVSTELFLVLFMIAMKATTPLKSVLIATVVVGLLYLFFNVVLMVPTPSGIFI